jgi:hypothetical protein
MITIHKVDTYDGNDGRSLEEITFFFDKTDADNFYNLDRRVNSKPIGIAVWEKNEFSTDAVKRVKALAKLTEEDKKILGLK